MTDVGELRCQIAEAFARRSYPGDDRIADTDLRYPDYEGNTVAGFHRGKRWQEITLSRLRAGYEADPSACLAFMTPEGWRYYLPAYLLLALDRQASGAIGDAVVGALTHPRARADLRGRVTADLAREPEDVLAEQSTRFEERVSGLSEPERDAVRAALEHLAEEVDAENESLDQGLPNDARAALESWSWGG